ncbi:MAG: hypothetical protein KGL39_37000 [Patescibacteria group bacterium]|nr:hypothetical protein [Patescibacteria group bacterium]
MPLSKGASNATRKANIKEVVQNYEATGKIGNSRPQSPQKAVKQAVAIGYAEQRRARRGRAK